MRRRAAWRRPVVWVPAVVALAAAAAVALALFQPWKLVVDMVVDEPLPQAAPAPTGTADPSPMPSAREPARPTELAAGRFVSHEHGTSGRAVVLELADGSRVLRLEQLDTSNGPDLRVWLSKAPVIEGTDGWFVFDDYDSVDLGELKGNVGNQNYAIPPSVDVTNYRSVSIWCARFRVSFGAAELTG